MMGTNFGQTFTNLLPALESKRNEFVLYGYTTVTKEDIWVYCLRKVWRNKNVEELPVHKIANDILQISPAAFMTFTQIEAQRDADWFSDLNSDELQMLLGPRNENNAES
ncbi:post-transcriptional regulator [Sporosarcina ureilytica]|nr:post-transcriptional regulator [Sporosarcina ureilytica]